MTTTNPGIDYSLGQANRDGEFHFGVIPTNDFIADEIYDNGDDEDFQNFKDQATKELTDAVEGALKDYLFKSAVKSVVEAAVDELDEHIGDAYQGGDGCTRMSYEDGGYHLRTDSDGDCWVLKSPYYTNAQYCNPCAPGAGYLRRPCPDGPKTYCLGHDWFEGGVAPYPVFSVEDGSEVKP